MCEQSIDNDNKQATIERLKENVFHSECTNEHISRIGIKTYISANNTINMIMDPGCQRHFYGSACQRSTL